MLTISEGKQGEFVQHEEMKGESPPRLTAGGDHGDLTTPPATSVARVPTFVFLPSSLSLHEACNRLLVSIPLVSLLSSSSAPDPFQRTLS
jgi:hypothetical protein